MSQQQPDRPRSDRDHPVVAGLAALVGVGLVVGLLVGGATLVATRVLGLGSDSGGGGSTGTQSLYLPPFTALDSPTGPLLTLSPAPEDQTSSAPPVHGRGKGAHSGSSSSSPAAEEGISLQAGQGEVSEFDQIDLTGVYPGGEGAILQVQRYQGGSWVDFPVTASVSNQTFATYVQTSQQGVNRFRVIDTDSGLTSNEVRVRVR